MPVCCVAFSPNGRLLAGSYSNGTVQVVWDADTGQELLTWREKVTWLSMGRRVTYSPDGRRLATCGAEGVTVWDATTGQKGCGCRDRRIPSQATPEMGGHQHRV